MAKAAKDTSNLLIVPNTGADATTGLISASNIFPISSSNRQPGYAKGEVLAKKGHKKVITITWKYADGDEWVRGFKEAFEKSDGKVVKELRVHFPNVEFKALLAEIAATNPAAIHTFFCRRRRQVRQGLAGAGLKKSIPPYDADFLSDGTLEAQDADGLLTALHYANALGTPRETSFRLVYAKAYKMHPGVYAVQGYRAAQLLGVGLAAVKQRYSQEG